MLWVDFVLLWKTKGPRLQALLTMGRTEHYANREAIELVAPALVLQA
jgi:hypothetical protein